MKKLFLSLFAAGIFFLVAMNFWGQKIYVTAEVDGEKKIIAQVEAKKNLPLVINFIHSVQKTPVIEELEFDGENFILRRTIYKSHGVGLPFLESDGTFREENGCFVMDDMNREIRKLELRTGVGTELCITLGEKELRLYEQFPPGTKISVSKGR